MQIKVLTGIAAAFIIHATPVRAGSYVDAYTWFGQAPHAHVMSINSYETALEQLRKQFDYICGDTFCEGDFSNLTSLGFDCSLELSSGAIGQCAWTFAGSYADVDPTDGKLHVTRKVFVCQLGIRGDARILANYLRQAGARSDGYAGLRDVAIPGRGQKTLMDVLTDCF